MTDKSQTFANLIEKSRSTDIPLLLKAKEDAKIRVKDDPSAANLAALEKAEKMLNAALAGRESGQCQQTVFQNLPEVIAYLREKGRKISKSQIYRDLKSGLLQRRQDGAFSQADVNAYGELLPVVALPQPVVDEQVDLARKKLEAEVAKLNEQRVSLVFAREKEMGKYIPRAEVCLELAARAMALSIGLRNMFRVHAADFIRLVNGDLNRVEELAQEFENRLNSVLNEYSKPVEITLEIIGDDEAGYR